MLSWTACKLDGEVGRYAVVQARLGYCPEGLQGENTCDDRVLPQQGYKDPGRQRHLE